MTFIYYTFIVIFMLVCLILSAVILVQESKSMGLGASFGGDNADALFGTSTAQVLKKFTAILATVFLALCVALSIWTSALGRHQSFPKAVTIEESHES